MRLVPAILVIAIPSLARADVGADVAITASTGPNTIDGSIGGDADHTITIGGYQIVLDAGATLHATTSERAGLATRAQIAFDPAPLPPGNLPRYRWSTFPFTFELAHEGELGALPKMFDRADVRRAPYSWQRVTLATRALRIERAAENADGDRTTGAQDFVAVHASAETLAQDDLGRLALSGSVALGEVTDRTPFAGHGDMFALERNLVLLRDGQRARTDMLWIFRLGMDTEIASADCAWGIVLDRETPGTRPVAQDHVKPRSVVTIGFDAGTERGGGGLHFERKPYVSLDGLGMFEDRGSIDFWMLAKKIRWTGRAFGAYTWPTAEQGSWTGGVELDASRRVGAFDLDLDAEAGRGFYGPLDGAAPTPTSGARAALTIKRTLRRSSRSPRPPTP